MAVVGRPPPRKVGGLLVVKRGNLLVPLDRNPLELFLLGLCVFSGVVNGIRLFATGQTLDQTPLWLAWSWYVLLIVGGLAGIVGAYWKDAITGVLIVRAAMWPVAAGAFMYAIVLPGRVGVQTAALVAAFGACCAWRAVQITRHVREENRKRVIVQTRDEQP